MAIPQIRLKYLDRPVDKLHPLVIRFLKAIPFKCVFEGKYYLLGRKIRLPKLCAINPIYNQIIDTKLKILIEDEIKNHS